MKKLNLIIFSICMTIFAFNSIFADGLEKSGEYSVYRRGGEIVCNEFVNEGKNIYYCTENGSIAVNSWIYVDDDKYYASKDGSIYINTTETIDGKGYVFNRLGKVRYGWIDGESYANEEGYLVTGFQQLPLYDGMVEDIEGNAPGGEERHNDIEEEIAWYYFQESGANKYKKYFSEEGPYVSKNINSKKYCFDEEGRMCVGWKMVKEKSPIMSGYMYFAEDDTDDFVYGQAVTSTWFALPGPNDDEVNGEDEVRYYYFLSTGFPICAKEGGKLKQRIGEKYYLFNDQGYVEYGIKKVGDDYFYFGNSVSDSSMRTGKVDVDTGDGYKLSYYFDEETGKGYTGVYRDKLYYKGLLQKAIEGSSCEAIKVNGVTRLVNGNGQLMKNKKKYKDSDGIAWSTNSGGVVTYTDEGIERDPDIPEETGN